MERLAELIGPSPSELSRELLVERVREIHKRTVSGLESGARAWGEKAKRKAAKRKPGKVKMAKKLEKEFGMSLSDMKEKLRKLREYEEAEKEKVIREDRKLACQQDEQALKEGERR